MYLHTWSSSHVSPWPLLPCLCPPFSLEVAKHTMTMLYDLTSDAYERPSAAGLRLTVTVLQYASPIVMLIFFLAAFTTHSIAASNSNANIA
jgi:hypothetical protein